MVPSALRNQTLNIDEGSNVGPNSGEENVKLLYS